MQLTRGQKAAMLDALDVHQSYVKGEIARVHGYKPGTCLEPKHPTPAHKAAWLEGWNDRDAKIEAMVTGDEAAAA